VPGVINQGHDADLVSADIKNKLVVLLRLRAGLCLEARRFSETPNQPAFPSARLASADDYQQRTSNQFMSGKPCS
jgi:galactose mutarotase-like enzyme